jgi:glycosyltransferase involved in cell wall biosynthesis
VGIHPPALFKKMSIEIHQIVPRIHQKASGTTTVLTRLCEVLATTGNSVELHVVKGNDAENNFPVRVYPSIPFLKNLGISPKMKGAIRELSKKEVIIHNHSLWMMPNIYPGLVFDKNSKAKLVVSPHGTLSTWARSRSKSKKMVAWYLGQKKTLDKAHCFHATSAQEVFDIRSMGYKQPIAFIPNGIDLPNEIFSIEKKKEILFLGRLHPVKGIEFLLDIWSNLESDFPEWELKIVGPPYKDGYLESLHNLVNQLGCKQVKFCSPVYNQEKYKTYAQAAIYILPTYSENFGVTVGEALINKTPVIVSEGGPWEKVEEKKCGWWVKRDKQSFERTIRSALNTSMEELNQMGELGSSWIHEDFDWRRIGAQYIQLYNWLLNKDEKPAFVDTIKK